MASNWLLGSLGAPQEGSKGPNGCTQGAPRSLQGERAQNGLKIDLVSQGPKSSKTSAPGPWGMLLGAFLLFSAFVRCSPSYFPSHTNQSMVKQERPVAVAKPSNYWNIATF